MARSKQSQRKSGTVKEGKASKSHVNKPVETMHKRYVSWREMDVYLEENGYIAVTTGFVEGDEVFVRVDKYADDGGKECSVLWRATYGGSDSNPNTGTLQHLLTYTQGYQHLVYPRRHTSYPFFGGNSVSSKDSDVCLYKKDVNACACQQPGCYFCDGGSDS